MGFTHVKFCDIRKIYLAPTIQDKPHNQENGYETIESRIQFELYGEYPLSQWNEKYYLAFVKPSLNITK